MFSSIIVCVCVCVHAVEFHLDETNKNTKWNKNIVIYIDNTRIDFNILLI